MLGPVEVIAIGFKGNQFKGEIIPALREVVNQGVIRIIDLVFIQKKTNGSIQIKELKDLDTGLASNLNPVIGDIMGLISEDDIRKMAEEMENNTSAGIMVFEHLWAKRFKEAVIGANGRLIADMHIPYEVVEAAEAASETLVQA